MSSNYLHKRRIRASGIHLAISLTLALIAAALVFGVWFPFPYSEISGGRELFLIVISVDVVLGPLITLVIATPQKTWPVLRRDIALVGVVQLCALAYGLWTVSVARPVFLAFEYDRFRVVHAIEVQEAKQPAAAPTKISVQWGGPQLIGVRRWRNDQEKVDMTLIAMQGVHPSYRPELWQPYAMSEPDVLKQAKPVAALKTRFPDQSAVIDKALADSGLNSGNALWLPMIGRKSFWTVLLDPVTAQPKAYVPLDSF